MLCRDGQISLISFLSSILTTVSTSVFVLFYFALDLTSLRNCTIVFGTAIVLYIIHCAIALVVLTENELKVNSKQYFIPVYCTNRFRLQIVKRAAVLGLFFGISTTSVIFAAAEWKRLAIYFLCMATFHYTEYLTIAWSNPRSLSTDTFMLNHSLAYILAAVTSWIEFCIEVYFWPWLKQSTWPLVAGIAICVAGEILRKLAIITANTNFNHIVQFRKVDGHTLVTHGVYKYMRHPSYAGWFWWSIGTQCIMANPICVILYAIASWKFFHERILIEEVTLVNFFQRQYTDYQERTCSGVPFVRGYVEGAYDASTFRWNSKRI